MDYMNGMPSWLAGLQQKKMYGGGTAGFREGGNNIDLPSMTPQPPLGGAGGNMAFDPRAAMGPPPPLGGAGGNMAPSPYGPSGPPQGWEPDPNRQGGVRPYDPRGQGFDPTRGGGGFYRPTNWQQYLPGGSMAPGAPQIAPQVPQAGGAFGQPRPMPQPIGGGGMQPRYPTPIGPQPQQPIGNTLAAIMQRGGPQRGFAY